MANSCDPIDCSPSGSSVHGVLQARVLEWVAVSFSRGSSQFRDQTCVSCIAGSLLHCRLSHQGSPHGYIHKSKLIKLYTLNTCRKLTKLYMLNTCSFLYASCILWYNTERLKQLNQFLEAVIASQYLC